MTEFEESQNVSIPPTEKNDTNYANLAKWSGITEKLNYIIGILIIGFAICSKFFLSVSTTNIVGAIVPGIYNLILGKLLNSFNKCLNKYILSREEKDNNNATAALTLYFKTIVIVSLVSLALVILCVVILLVYLPNFLYR